MTTAKLFKNGKSQAVRLPKDYRFEGNEVVIKKVGNGVILLPKEQFYQVLIDSLGMFTDDFMDTRDQPKLQEREEWFE